MDVSGRPVLSSHSEPPHAGEEKQEPSPGQPFAEEALQLGRWPGGTQLLVTSLWGQPSGPECPCGERRQAS